MKIVSFSFLGLFIITFVGSTLCGLIGGFKSTPPYNDYWWIIVLVVGTIGSFLASIACVSIIFNYGRVMDTRLVQETRTMPLSEMIQQLDPRTRGEILVEILTALYSLTYQQQLHLKCNFIDPYSEEMLATRPYRQTVKNQLMEVYINSWKNDINLEMSRFSARYFPRDILQMIIEYLKHWKPSPREIARRLNCNEETIRSVFVARSGFEGLKYSDPKSLESEDHYQFTEEMLRQFF